MKSKSNPIKKLAIALLLLISTASFAQSIIVNDPNDPETSLGAEELINEVLVSGSGCVEISLTNLQEDPAGVNNPNLRSWGYFNNNGTSFPFQEGIILSSGRAVDAEGPNTSASTGNGTGIDWQGDIDIETILNNFTGSTITTNNATVFEFTFTSLIEEVDFEYIFASEEYEDQFECDDNFRDGFAFLIRGPGLPDDSGTPFGGTNIATIAGSDNVPVNTLSIHLDDIEGGNNCGSEIEGVNFFPDLYVSNQGPNDSEIIEFDGLSTDLSTATVTVIPGEIYTAKLVIADRFDSGFDSAVFINAGSFNVGSTDLGDNLLVALGTAPCEGDTITLDATDPTASAYTWFMDDIEIVGETNPTLDVTLAGTYRVEVELIGLDDCIIQDDVIVQFINGDSVNIGDDITACDGDPTTLTLPALGDLTTYAWFLDGVEIAGETDFSLDVTASGTYTVEATFAAGCTFSDDAVVTLSVTPMLTLGSDINTCFAETVQLDATPTNADPADVNYSWLLDGVLIAGETNPTLNITTDGIYTVNADVNGCSTTDIIVVNLLDIAIDLGTNLNSCLETPETLTAVLTNIDAANASIVWSLDGNVIAGETEETLEITEAGIYMVEITSGVCTAMSTVIVTQANPDGTPCDVVDPDDDGCAIVDAGPDGMVSCENPCTDLTATFFGLTGSGVLPFLDTSSYTVDLVDCPLPAIDSGDPTNITTDDIWSDVIDIPFTFSFFGNDYTGLIVGANGQISFNLGLADQGNGWSFEPDELLPFTDEDTEPNGPEFPLNTIYGAFHDIDPSQGGDINFFVSGTAPFRTFVLNFNEVPQFFCNDLLTTQQIILYETFNVIDVNIIEKEVCDDWNDGLAVIGLMGNDLTEFSVPPGRNTGAWAASNESWRFLPNGAMSDPNVAFEWTDEDGNIVGTEETVNVCPLEDTTYTFTVSVTDNAGNVIGSASDTATVTVDSLGNFEIDLGADQSLCDEDSFEIVNTLAGDDVDTATFLWNTGDTTQNLVVTETGTYTVEVTVGNCSLMESVFILLGESPILDLGEDFATCFDVTVLLDATPSNVDPMLVTYQWFQDGIELADNGPTLEIVELGTYQVVADFEGCSSTDSITISNDSLVVSLPEGFTTCPNEEQTLVASTDETNVTYQWFLNGDPITGATNSTLDISIVPEALGDQIYEVQITRGVCVGNAQIPISLYEIGNCVISQGISPDGSPGFNDTLDLTFLSDRSGIENLEIYNRHGRLIFERANYVNEWAGQTDISGDLLPTGTYFYVINFTNEDPVYGRQSTGWVYLNRDE